MIYSVIDTNIQGSFLQNHMVKTYLVKQRITEILCSLKIIRKKAENEKKIYCTSDIPRILLTIVFQLNQYVFTVYMV